MVWAARSRSAPSASAPRPYSHSTLTPLSSRPAQLDGVDMKAWRRRSSKMAPRRRRYRRDAMAGFNAQCAVGSTSDCAGTRRSPGSHIPLAVPWRPRNSRFHRFCWIQSSGLRFVCIESAREKTSPISLSPRKRHLARLSIASRRTRAGARSLPVSRVRGESARPTRSCGGGDAGSAARCHAWLRLVDGSVRAALIKPHHRHAGDHQPSRRCRRASSAASPRRRRPPVSFACAPDYSLKRRLGVVGRSTRRRSRYRDGVPLVSATSAITVPLSS